MSEKSKAQIAQEQMKKASTWYMGLKPWQRRMIGGGGGAVIASAEMMLNNKDEDAIDATIKIGGGFAADILMDKAMESYMQKKGMLPKVAKDIDEDEAHKVTKGGDESEKVTIKDVHDVDQGKSVSDAEKKIDMGEIKRQESIKRAEKQLANADAKAAKWAAGGRFAIGGALGMLALGTAAHISNNMHERTIVERQKRDAERNFQEQQKQERRQLEKMGYGNIDLGEIAFQMFDERIGHFKMGNSKFQ